VKIDTSSRFYNAYAIVATIVFSAVVAFVDAAAVTVIWITFGVCFGWSLNHLHALFFTSLVLIFVVELHQLTRHFHIRKLTENVTTQIAEHSKALHKAHRS
jgi:low affinity Fe/Cu permease